MSAAPPVGVVGASGGVGRAAVRRLAAAGVGPLRLGGRRLEPLRRLVVEDLGGEGEAAPVDAACAESLDRFCAGCCVVVDCAGPSREVGDAVVRAAWRAGVDAVVAGDPAVAERAPGRTAVVAAGLMPGLSGLLPRCLAARFDRPMRLTGYAGGLGRLTPAAAADYLAAGSGQPLAAWRQGRRASRALTPLRDVELAPFPSRVTAQPYLSAELECVARSLGLADADWYNVLDGVPLPAALARARDAADVARASELDLFGRTPYQLVVLEMAGEVRGQPSCQTLLLRARDGIELTGAVVALVALAVLAGEVPFGVHAAWSTLTPDAWWGRLRDLPEVEALEVVDGPAAGAVEEGEL